MALIKCNECENEISKQAKTCPNCGAKNKKRLTLGKIIILLFGGMMLIGLITDNDTVTSSYSDSGSSQTVQTTINNNVEQAIKLETSAWACTKKRKYMYLEGEVKNISDKPIRNLMAIATFRGEDDIFIKSDNSLVDYNPLMPGQTSPFKVMSSDNPAIEKCRLSFKTMMGGKIRYKGLDNEQR